MSRPRLKPAPKVGSRFGRLVVIRRSDPYRNGRPRWLCRCDCGSTTRSGESHLLGGRATSCGCISREKTIQRNYRHGAGGTPTHASWKAMISRCTRETVAQFHRYGGRGIKVCDRWFTFGNFIADMGIRPAGTSIDRFPDADGNYEPGNCRWATRQEQNHDRDFRGNTKLTIDTAQEALGRIGHGESRRSVAARLNVSEGCIGLLYRGCTWKELDRPWLRVDHG